MADERYNLRNPAVKRILQEVRELQNSGSDDFMSLPAPDNIFEWHFAICGPEETEFEGGIYHGRIQLPPEYPFKPPAFMLLTPNGRFETQTKICLSISQHHPEHWQPSWSVRTALVALIAFMPTKPDGALGSLSYNKEERRALAVKSRSSPPKFGNPERQQLIDEIHEFMLSRVAPLPNVRAVASPSPFSALAIEERETRENESPTDNVRELETLDTSGENPHGDSRDIRVVPSVQLPVGTDGGLSQGMVNGGFTARLRVSGDLGLTILAIGLTVAILALLIKKVLTIPLHPTVDS